MKRLLKQITALLTIIALSPTAILAQGGNDPISGIDVIIKKDPGSKKVADFSLSDKEIKLQKRKMSFDDRRAYLVKSIAPRLEKLNKTNGWKIDWKPVLLKALDRKAYNPKADQDEIVVLTLSVPKDANQSGVRHKLTNRKSKDAPAKTKQNRKK